jgi:4-hydroxybenzoate polyprenyltransferase
MGSPSPAAMWSALRPAQWLKNGFALAPLVFSGNLVAPNALARAAAAALALCLVSSAGYLINDILDREVDRQHPRRRHRPIAAGRVTTPTALALAAAAALAGILVTLPLPSGVLGAVSAYLVLTTLYSLGLKLIPIADVAILATGFGLRLLAGAAAVPVRPSHWLLICGVLLALLLALGKRAPEPGAPSRRGAAYPPRVLRSAVILVAVVTVSAYIAYTIAPEVIARLAGPWLLFTVPLVVWGVGRYVGLVLRRGAQDPSTLLLTDRTMQFVVGVWAAVAGVLVTWFGAPSP